MELILLLIAAAVAIRFRRWILFIGLFLGALYVLLMWTAFLEASGLGIVLAVIGCVIGAWIWAKRRAAP